jgi:hypothetical protein
VPGYLPDGDSACEPVTFAEARAGLLEEVALDIERVAEERNEEAEIALRTARREIERWGCANSVTVDDGTPLGRAYWIEQHEEPRR